jgi:hypothetical protein
MKLTRMTRTAGWLAVAGLLSAALIAPTTVNAQGADPFNSDECEGYTYYFKIQAPSDGTYDDGDSGVETNWPGQVITISNGADGNQEFDWASTEVVLKVAVKFGNDYFHPAIAADGLSGHVDNNNQNGISHVTWCGNPVTTTTTTETTDTETTETQTTETQTTETQTTETQTTETETTETETTETQTTETTPEGSVEAETGTPDVTPPSTDTGSISGPSSPSGSAWQLLLVAMAGLLATVLLLTPAAEARKR